LISIGPDYWKAGEQAGRMARQVLDQTLRLEELEDRAPEALVITVNGEVARRLGISFPPGLHQVVLEAPPEARQ
jgi:ABC-type uncharacterized transport system substrate-binding protein